MILKYTYRKILINKRNKIYETFDYTVIHNSETFDKDKTKLNRWCRKNCKNKYKLNTPGCHFQTRDDAEAFELKWMSTYPLTYSR